MQTAKKEIVHLLLKQEIRSIANSLYEYIIAACKKELPVVETGSIGADMKVELMNDGPFTIVLDSDELIK